MESDDIFFMFIGYGLMYISSFGFFLFHRGDADIIFASVLGFISVSFFLAYFLFTDE